VVVVAGGRLSVRRENLAPAPSAVAPRRLIRWLPRLFEVDYLSPGAQHDSGEFLVGVVRQLNKDALKRIPEGSEETTLAGRALGGALVNATTCTKCAHTTFTYDLFQQLALEIADATSTLTEMLQLFTATERLDKRNMFRCDECGSDSRARKQLLVAEAPCCLVVQLKRFKLQTSGIHQKNNKFVEFPEELNLRPFICRGRAEDAPEYTLLGVVVHLDKGGSASSGHYISYVRVGGDWYLCDDEAVRMASRDEVLGSNAYLLFYHRTARSAAKLLEYQSRMRALRPESVARARNAEPSRCRVAGCEFFANTDGLCSGCYRQEYGQLPPPPPKMEAPEVVKPPEVAPLTRQASPQSAQPPLARQSSSRLSAASDEKAAGRAPAKAMGKKTGVNDPCPCGSGLKYKKCHGKS